MRFTIGIPAYKAKFLNECVESILSQSFNDFELVIVNDASPENLDLIVNKFNDKRIRYLKNSINYGAIDVVDNWNKCLSYANGEYFVLMGDDDRMLPNYLAEFNKLIEEFPGLGIYHCRTIVIDENSNFVTLTETRPDLESTYESIWHRISGKRTQFISDYVYLTQTLKKNGGFFKIPLAWGSDDISAYISSYPNGIAHTNNPLFMYRSNSLNISSTGKIEIKINAMEIEKEWIFNFIKNNHINNEIDSYLAKMILNQLDTYILKKKLYAITEDISNNICVNFFKWIRLRKKYEISISLILYALILSVKERKKVIIKKKL